MLYIHVKNKTNLGGMRVKGSCINVIHFDIVKAMQPINRRRGSRRGKEHKQ